MSSSGLSAGARRVVAFWFGHRHRGPVERGYAREVIAEMQAAKRAYRGC